MKGGIMRKNKPEVVQARIEESLRLKIKKQPKNTIARKLLL